MVCRICNSEAREILDLGFSPPANSLLKSRADPQESYPLVVETCDACGNMQLRDCLSAHDLYKNYLYATPDSKLLSQHYERLLEYLSSNGYLHTDSVVVEVGSNVGLFLKYLKPHVGRVLGVDPAANICEIARASGVDTICDFFDPNSAKAIRKQVGATDVIVARHCFAHNCDPHVMVQAAVSLLGESGFFVIENAYALNTIANNEFDQIYHEHMFYFSIRSMEALLRLHGMRLVDLFLSSIHGGSIVFVAQRAGSGKLPKATVDHYRAIEEKELTTDAYQRFASNAFAIREQLRRLIDLLRSDGKTVYTYGATAKGNTLLNFLGLTSQDIPLCVDNTPTKQGRFLPRSLIEVISEEQAATDPPDYYLLTAWNYKDEIIEKVRQRGNQHSEFIIPIPFPHIVEARH